MFFRGRHAEPSIARRFRTSGDAFAFNTADGHYIAHVVATAERSVDLYHALAEYLPPAVEVEIVDLRTDTRWRGSQLALPDVRDAVARLKTVLSTFAGVEITIYADEDQLTLDGNLDVWVYALTERWLYLLRGKGLVERDEVRGRTWRLRPSEFPAAPGLSSALTAAMERLGLAPE
jgi:hypothetical protein